MIRSTALLNGHYECRSFEETIPILQEFCALEVVGETVGSNQLGP